MRRLRWAGGLAAAAVLSAAPAARADTLNLYTAGSSGTINGALFQQIDIQPSGTGFISPFVRIQGPGNGGYERGYNTDGVAEFDTKEYGGHNWNHSIQIKDLATVNIGGVDYYQFWLDANEPNAQGNQKKDLIDLVELRVFLSNTGNNTGYPNLGTKIFDMDVGAQGDSTVGLDGDLAPGSGHYDMIANIRKSLFTGSDTQYIYLYSAFGNSDDLPGDAAGGFEEWTAKAGVQAVPLPLTVWGGLSLLGIAGGGRYWRKRREL
jgi:hypothetical protein